MGENFTNHRYLNYKLLIPVALVNFITYLVIFDPFEVFSSKITQPKKALECPKNHFSSFLSPTPGNTMQPVFGQLSSELRNNFDQGFYIALPNDPLAAENGMKTLKRFQSAYT